MSYRRRIVDDVLDELFPNLAAIALEGAKGVGKTATAGQRAATVISLDLPGQRETVAADVDHIMQVPRPVLIDEWQLHPAVWDRVRMAWTTTTPVGISCWRAPRELPPGVRIHSGAGRIVSIAMRPMSLAERGFGRPNCVAA